MARKKNKGKKEPAENNSASSNFVYNNNNRTRGLMWVGVITLSTVIIVLWGWNMTLKISNINFGLTPEKQMVSNAQNDWNKIFEETKTKAGKQQSLSQIKNILKEIANAASTNTTSTIPTSTINIPTTTKK